MKLNLYGKFRIPVRMENSHRVNFLNAFLIPEMTSLVNEVRDILLLCQEPRTREEIVALIGKTQYYAMQTLVYPMVNDGLLAMTIPDKPKSRYQKFVTTSKGLKDLEMS